MVVLSTCCKFLLCVCRNLIQIELSSSHEHRPRTGSMLACIPQRWSHWGAVRKILVASSTSTSSPASILLNVTQESTFSFVGMPTLTTLRGIFTGFLGGVIVFSNPAVSYSLSTPAIEVTAASASLDCFCTSGDPLCRVRCPRCHLCFWLPQMVGRCAGPSVDKMAADSGSQSSG